MSSKDNRQSPLAAMAIAGTGVGGIGCAIPLLAIAAILVGRKIDAWLGTTPWVVLLLVLGSIIAGVVMMLSSAYSAARAAERQYMANRRESRGTPDDPHAEYGEDNR
jgi:F0F1-type ATP synthase assembly protein I